MGVAVSAWGANLDEAREHSEALAQEHGYRYSRSGNEPHLIAGVATEALEMLEDEPELEVIIVPIGGGSGAAGTCLTAHALNPALRVIGVQSAAAAAAYESWRQRRLTTAPNHTIAEGLVTGTAFALPPTMHWQLLHDFILLTDEEILRAQLWLIELA